MEKQRIAILTLYYPPEMFGNAPIVRSVVEAMAREGMKPHVVTATPHHRVDPHAKSEANGATVHRVVDLKPVTGVRSQLANWYRYARAAADWLRSQEGMIVISVTPPFFFPKLLEKAVSERGHHLIHWVQDMYPAAIEVEKPVHPLASKVVRSIVRKSLAVPRQVIAVTDDWKTELTHELSVPEEKLRICENWCGTCLHAPPARRRGRPRRLLFAGNLGRMADLRTVIEALANLQDEEWILDICGTGVRLNEIRALAEPLGSRVQFHGAVPEGQLASFYQDASVGIVPLQPGGSRASVPSKTYSYWAAALPVLCIVDPNSHFDKLLKQHTVGWSAPAGDTEALTQTIRQALRASDETLDAMGARARQLYEQRYSPEAGSRRFLETLLRILNEGDFESPIGRAPRSISPEFRSGLSHPPR